MRKPVSLFLLSCSLFLVACGGEGGSVACDQEYWDGELGFCVPDGWTVLDGATLRERGAPAETILALQYGTAVSGEFPVMTIMSERVRADITAAQYSEASITTVSAIGGYDRVQTDDVTIDDEDVEIHIFTSKPEEDQPRRRFYQLSTVNDATGYTLTAATPVSIEGDLEDQILTILRSLTFTDTAAEE